MKSDSVLLSRLGAAAVLTALLTLGPTGHAQSEAPPRMLLAQAESAAKAEEVPEKEPQEQWKENEAQLFDLMAKVAEDLAKEEGGAAIDWAAVQQKVAEHIFSRARTDNKASEWPTTQRQWVQTTKKGMERDAEKDKAEHQDFTNELKVLTALEEALRGEAEAAETGEAAVAKEGDDPTWRYRDKSGARTTKPRYKGQEPVN